MTDNREIYESQYSASNYRRSDEGYFSELRRVKEKLLDTLPASARVLDLGCGSGEFMLPLLRRGVRVEGLDFSEGILSALSRSWTEAGGRAEDLVLHAADARNSGLEDACFDAVFSFSSLYTIPDHDALVDEIRRILRPGGVAMLEFGNSRSLNDLEARRTGTGVECFHHPSSVIRSRLCGAGFEIVEERSFQLFPCWGGGTTRASEILNPEISRWLAERIDGRMLDELVSSSPVLEEFAFRKLMVVRKVESPVAIAPRDYAQRADYGYATELAAAQLSAQNGELVPAVQGHCDILRVDPGHVPAALSLAALFDGVEEQARVTRWRKSLERLALRRRPTVSVVLPVYNMREYVGRAIEALTTQTYRDFELIVVDDGSTDGTGEYLDSIQDPRVRVIHQENQRLPNALNRGFSVSRGRYLTWVSADNVSSSFMLEALVGALEANPNSDLVVSGFAWIDEEDNVLGVHRPSDLSYRGFLCRNPGVVGFLYRRSAVAGSPGYAPELEGAEDWDYWLRIVERRGSAVLVPEVLCYYRSHDGSMTQTIPAKVEASSREVVHRAMRRCRELSTDALYPHLSVESADACAASLDFARRLLESPFCDDSLSAPFLEDWLERVDRSTPFVAAAARAVELALQAGTLSELLSLPLEVFDSEREQLVVAEAQPTWSLTLDGWTPDD